MVPVGAAIIPLSLTQLTVVQIPSKLKYPLEPLEQETLLYYTPLIRTTD